MKAIRRVLPNFASDTAGACSALFEMGGLTVIHDAAGCMESYSAYDEPRMFGSDSMIFSSSLKNTEAVTGDESKLIKKVSNAAIKTVPPFIALVGSPVPYTIGTDLEGIAAEIESETAIPTFAVGAGGFRGYDYGASEAMLKYFKKIGLKKKPEGFTVNLLGATPLDISENELKEIKNALETAGAENVLIPFMGDMLYESDANIVISAAGLAIAKHIKNRFGIPYITGMPIGQKLTDILMTQVNGEKTQACTFSGGDVLVIGEAIYAVSMAKAIQLETGLKVSCGITGMTDKEITNGVSSTLLTNEESVKEELEKGYRLIIADPLYRLISKNIPFIERRHQALSSHLFNEPDGFEVILKKVKEVL
ncbi:MAG: hypothetical protein IJD14_07240 [Christensenellaceae bacterium]|nr:hypothetical protein [Christensenellaceae bacterium]